MNGLSLSINRIFQGTSDVVPTRGNFTMDFPTLASGRLPQDMMTVGSGGTWASANDGTNNYIKSTSQSTFNAVIVPSTLSSNISISFKLTYLNVAAPASSFFYPGFQTDINGSEYQFVMCRSSGNDARGAAWFQKNVFGSGATTLGSGIGVSSTTFSANVSYQATIACTGAGTRTMTAQIQRLSDNFWLNSGGTWQAGAATALTVNDSSFTAPGSASLNTYHTADDFRLYSYTSVGAATSPHYRATPVIAKSGTVGGWANDAVAAPGVCWDGTKFVCTVSLWSIALQKWASVFYTSTDMITWTYVTNSILVPQGTDYILGNGAIEWYNNAYYFIYNHYPLAGGTTDTIVIIKSTDLVNWTTVTSDLTGAAGADPHIVKNPNSGKLEAWYVTVAREMALYDSPDGITWTSRGVFYTHNSYTNPRDVGAYQPFYWNGVRYMTCDTSDTNVSGNRKNLMYHSPGSNTTWIFDGIMNTGSNANAWENACAFDGAVIVANTGDTRGAIPRLLYAGSDIYAPTDTTNSSLGLTYIVV